MSDDYETAIVDVAFRVYGLRLGDLVHHGGVTGRISQFFPRPDRQEPYGPRIAAWVDPVDPPGAGAAWSNCKDLIPAVLHQLASV